VGEDASSTERRRANSIAAGDAAGASASTGASGLASSAYAAERQWRFDARRFG